MPLANYEGIYIFFAHVPKTGGSSIEDYLLRRFGSLSVRIDLASTGVAGAAPSHRRSDLIMTPQHMTAADIQHFLPAKVDYSFAVVRDPMARMISEYRFQAGISQASRLGFSTWLRLMLAAARIDPRIYENHIRPQGDLVPTEAEAFRLEDGFAPLIARLDVVTGVACPEISVHHLLKSGTVPVDVRQQDVELIAHFYAADYARFGYPLPDAQTRPHDRIGPLRALLARVLGRAVVWKQHRAWLQ